MTKERYLKLVLNKFAKFYKYVDRSHGLPHVTNVMKLALDMNEKLNLNVPYYDIVLAAIAHDIGNDIDRDHHHLYAAKWLLDDYKCHPDDDVYKYISSIELISDAVREHRASGSYEPSSTLSRLIASADRGEPNLYEIISRMRSYIYNQPDEDVLIISSNIKINNMSLNEYRDELISSGIDGITVKILTHLIDKYSRDGYCKYDQIYIDYFGDKIDDMYNHIDDISSDISLINSYV